LRYYSLLDFPSRFVALRGDGIDFVDEYYRRSVLLGFFKGLGKAKT
jgi:hypothetical protein